MALKINPRYIPALFIVAEISRFLKYHDQAAFFYLKAYEQDPQQPIVIQGLARSFYDSANYDELRKL